MKEKDDLGNIKVFFTYPLLYTFNKVRSPNSIDIVQNKDDDWFFHVITYRTKTGKIVNNSMIIKSDLDIWINSIKREGFSLKK